MKKMGGGEMSKVKLLIAENNIEEKTKLRELLERESEFEITGAADDGLLAIELAKKTNPDVVLCNFALKNADGITVCEKLREEQVDAKIIMLSSAFSDMAVKRMVDVGVDYHMIKPVHPDTLIKQINFLVNEDTSKTRAGQVMEAFPHIARQKVEQRLSNIFLTIGIPAHIKGYTYLCDAIRLTMAENTIINAITKRLYPDIAKKHSTSASKVERAIRHAIEVGWNRARFDKINEIFGVNTMGANDRPTNGEFIALVARKLLIEEIG